MGLSEVLSWSRKAGRLVLVLSGVIVLVVLFVAIVVMSVPLVAMSGALFLTAIYEFWSGKILSPFFWIFVQVVLMALAHAMGLRSPLPGILDYLRQNFDDGCRRAEASDYAKHGMAPARAAEIVGESQAKRLPEYGTGRILLHSLINYLAFSLFSVAVLFAMNWYASGSILPPG